MKYLAVSLVTIVAVELFIRLSVVRIASELPVLMKKATKVIISRKISDHWKEKVLLRYSRSLAFITLKMATVICIVSASVVLLSLLLEHLLTLQQSILDCFSSWIGLAVATVVSIIYIIVRSHLVSE